MRVLDTSGWISSAGSRRPAPTAVRARVIPCTLTMTLPTKGTVLCCRLPSLATATQSVMAVPLACRKLNLAFYTMASMSHETDVQMVSSPNWH